MTGIEGRNELHTRLHADMESGACSDMQYAKACVDVVQFGGIWVRQASSPTQEQVDNVYAVISRNWNQGATP